MFKVLHPGVYRQVQRDLTILRVCASVVEFLVPSLKWISLSECLSEFSTLMTRQVHVLYIIFGLTRDRHQLINWFDSARNARSIVTEAI